MSDSKDKGRDQLGRWKKGFCPNPNGRPRKKPKISDSDVIFFKNTIVDVTINGEQRQLTRHELLLHSMFEQAIKGKSATAARKLFERFEDADMLITRARDDYREMRETFLEKYYEHGEFDEELAEELLRLLELLKYGAD